MSDLTGTIAHKHISHPHSQPAEFGIYSNRAAVEDAITQLKGAGFQPQEISVLFPHNDTMKDLVHVPETKVVEGVEVGAGTGLVIGGILGWLAGVGLLAVPGIGIVIAAGPLFTALVSAGAAAGVGGMWGGIIGMGIPEKEAKHYETRIHKGDILLSVHCPHVIDLKKAKEIMLRTGAEDVYSRNAAVSSQ